MQKKEGRLNQGRWKSRTDLALEITEELKETDIDDGISLQTDYNKKKTLKETIIRIKNEKGETALGKKIGTYITLEGVDLASPDESFHEEMSLFLAQKLEKMLKGYEHILVAGLGNRQITSDSLGALVVDHLFVTRHLLREKILKNGRKISAIVPGVMGQTGMEAGEIIKGITQQVKPDVILAIDALAAKNVQRLNRTIQICNTGIAPGSGIGNHRKEISKESMGIEVIALGVPTVISVPSLINDALLGLADEEEEVDFSKYLPFELAGMFVTPKNIDDAVGKISFTISEAINQIVI